MKYQTAGAFRQALEGRLLASSHATGVSLARLRKLVAFDRLLARLVAVAPDRWFLKGGVALDLRLRDRARATMDMDLGRHDNETAAMQDFRAAELIDIGDYFEFTVERSPHFDQAAVADAVRYRVHASLDSRVFEGFVVDVGFGESQTQPDMIEALDLLAFADVPPIRVPTLPLSQHMAEKVHAYTRSYGPEGRQSTRVKDLVDLVLMAESCVFLAGDLRTALEATFTSRGGQPLPATFPEPPAVWRPQYRKLADPVGIATELNVAHRLVAAMLDPILGSRIADAGRWDPVAKEWVV
jgi:hypothetical protein